MLIGIDYRGTSFELGGCIHDVYNLRDFLIEYDFFEIEDIYMMHEDEPKDGVMYPTKYNIKRMLYKIIKFTNEKPTETTQIFISFSGHGYRVKDLNGDEDDGMDEVICPVDFKRKGFILDDYFRLKFIDQLPETTKVFTIVDACHSESMIDLRFTYDVAEHHKCIIDENHSETLCDVISLSGCGDTDFSIGAKIDDVQKGVMTTAFIQCYEDGINYFDLIHHMRHWIKKKGFTQIPCLSSGKRIHLKDINLLTHFE